MAVAVPVWQWVLRMKEEEEEEEEALLLLLACKLASIVVSPLQHFEPTSVEAGKKGMLLPAFALLFGSESAFRVGLRGCWLVGRSVGLLSP